MTKPGPWYGREHQKLREELLASGTWIGRPCFYCSKPMWPGQRLVLGHANDENGYSIPGKYVGITHYKCDTGAGGKVNPWGVRTRAKAARAARSPERQKQLDDLAARKEHKRVKSEFARVQQEIRDAANPAPDPAPVEDGREW